MNQLANEIWYKSLPPERSGALFAKGLVHKLEALFYLGLRFPYR